MRGGRYPKGETSERQFPDEVRRAAYDVCAAVRALEALTDDPRWRPNTLTVPATADLKYAKARLDEFLSGR